MDRYIGRCVDCLVERDLGIFGAVLIQGPKWCGKTTTAQRFAESSLSLSDPSGGFAALQLARLDPAQAIVGPTPRLVDEWQEIARAFRFFISHFISRQNKTRVLKIDSDHRSRS